MNTDPSMMNHDDDYLVALPDDLDDIAAAKLLEFFYELARVLENQYAGQLSRYYRRPDERQHSLPLEYPPPGDPPF